MTYTATAKDDDGPAPTVLLRLPDGTTHPEPQLTREWTNPGYYPVLLEATDADGLRCFASTRTTVLNASGALPPRFIEVTGGAVACGERFTTPPPRVAGEGPLTFRIATVEGASAKDVEIDAATGEVTVAAARDMEPTVRVTVEAEGPGGVASGTSELQITCEGGRHLQVGCGTSGGAYPSLLPAAFIAAMLLFRGRGHRAHATLT